MLLGGSGSIVLQCSFLGNLIWATDLDEKSRHRFLINVMFHGGYEFLKAVLLKHAGFYLQILGKLTCILKKCYGLISRITAFSFR